MTASVEAKGTPKRFDPMSGDWPVVIGDVVYVVGLTMACWLGVDAATSTTLSRVIGYLVVGSLAVLLCTALPLRYFLLKQRDEVQLREQQLGEESNRRQFEARLVRALDMAADAPAAVGVAMEATSVLSPDACGELLLGDSSRAHMQRVGGTGRTECGGTGHCDVGTPHACPAVRSGHAIHFEDSRLLDTCPYLRGRTDDPLAAVCVPVSVAGSAVGVLHLVRGADRPFEDREISDLTTVATMTGSRIGLVTAMAQSQLQANTDPLTGLLNRRSMENEVRTLLQRGEQIAVVLADLDHFKRLNDTYGHDAGDRALRVFARVLRRTVRDADIVCRYGGEEFLVVCPGADKEAAALVFDRVRLELEAALGDGRNPVFTVSAGVADSATTDDLTEMITHADIALLEAKAGGRNQTVVALVSV